MKDRLPMLPYLPEHERLLDRIFAALEQGVRLTVRDKNLVEHLRADPHYRLITALNWAREDGAEIHDQDLTDEERAAVLALHALDRDPPNRTGEATRYLHVLAKVKKKAATQANRKRRGQMPVPRSTGR